MVYRKFDNNHWKCIWRNPTSNKLTCHGIFRNLVSETSLQPILCILSDCVAVNYRYIILAIFEYCSITLTDIIAFTELGDWTFPLFLRLFSWTMYNSYWKKTGTSSFCTPTSLMVLVFFCKLTLFFKENKKVQTLYTFSRTLIWFFASSLRKLCFREKKKNIRDISVRVLGRV